jgi:hypothetical protein
MKIKTVKDIAKQRGIAFANMSKTQLIRAIQKAEGNRDCFATTQVRECDQVNCLWREDCLGSIEAS